MVCAGKGVLETVLTLHLNNRIQNSFTFAEINKTSKLDPSFIFLCSFDISSLFTDIPLAYIIQFSADDPLNRNTLAHFFLGKFLLNLYREMATSSVELSFDDIMHRRLTELRWDHPLDQPVPVFLLASMNLNFSRPLPS